MIDEDREYFKQRESHNYDPLGELYINTRNAIIDAQIIKDMDIPNEMIQIFLTYLSFEYTESTMDIPRKSGWWHSNPTTSYGTEFMIIFTTPIETKLPSNAYVLDRVRYKLLNNKKHGKVCDIFVGIQEFDLMDLKGPGKGNIVYAKNMKIEANDNSVTVYPCIPLKCSLSYMFWITCIDQERAITAELADSSEKDMVKRGQELKLTSGDCNYYAGRRSSTNRYRRWCKFTKWYDVLFRM